MRDYYADFLQTKNSVNTLPSEVSKVSKGQNLDTKQAFDTFDTALPSVNQKNYVSKNNDELTEIKADYFHSELNRLIENGVVFEVSADDFQTIDPSQILKTSDKEFLKLNYSDVLCTIQQALLVKHLFSHSPEQFEDFASEISDRESLMSDSNITAYELYRAAVMDVTRIWFENLLKNLF